MRALLILLAAAGGFAGYLVWNHMAAKALVKNEAAALEYLRGLAAAGAVEAREEAGYRFTREVDGDLPAVWVAAPIRPSETGVRWFVTTDGAVVFEFDTVLFRSPRAGPDILALRRHLTMTAEEQVERGPPVGWQTSE